MKIRSGFVSNSSSSSFIIAVPNKAKACKCCKRSDHWLLQAIQVYLGTFTKDGNKFYPITSAEHIVDHYKQQLDDLKASKEYSKKRLAVIAELQADPKVFENYERLKKELDRFRNRAQISITDEARYQETFDADKNLQDRKEQLERHLAEYDKNVAEIEDIIAKVKKFLKKDYTVYSFTIDNWATEAEKAIKDMLGENNLIETIWRVNT